MNKFFESINSSSIKLLEPLSLKETYKIILNEAIKLVEADYGEIYLESNGLFEKVYAKPDFLYSIKPRKKGFTYATFSKNKSLIVNIEEAEKVHPQLKKINVKSMVFTPLSYKKKSIGVLVNHSKKKVFNQENLEILGLFSSFATLAIIRAQTSNIAEKAVSDKEFYFGAKEVLERIHNASLKFLVPLTLEQTYKTIVDEAIKLVNGKYGSLMLEEDGDFKEVYSSLPIIINRRKKGFTYKAFKESKAFLLDTLESEDYRKNHPELIRLGVKSAIFIPLSYKNKSIGVMAITFIKKEKILERDLKILSTYGTLASLATKKAQLHYEAIKATEARDVFISMMAHELRTPLTTISGYIQLFYSKLNNFDSKYADWIKTLFSESKKFTALVNNLLEVNKIKEGQFDLHWEVCSVKEVIRKSLEDFYVNFPRRIINYHDKLNGKADKIVGDAVKLEQVVSNLLENAAKFSSNETKISLMLKQRLSNIQIIIKDEGKGIEKNKIHLIFEKFYTSHEEENIGIGLFLVKNIIKQHHGEIKISSKINKGTKIEILLPKVNYAK